MQPAVRAAHRADAHDSRRQHGGLVQPDRRDLSGCAGLRSVAAGPCVRRAGVVGCPVPGGDDPHQPRRLRRRHAPLLPHAARVLQGLRARDRGELCVFRYGVRRHVPRGAVHRLRAASPAAARRRGEPGEGSREPRAGRGLRGKPPGRSPVPHGVVAAIRADHHRTRHRRSELRHRGLPPRPVASRRAENRVPGGGDFRARRGLGARLREPRNDPPVLPEEVLLLLGGLGQSPDALRPHARRSAHLSGPIAVSEDRHRERARHRDPTMLSPTRSATSSSGSPPFLGTTTCS